MPCASGQRRTSGRTGRLVAFASQVPAGDALLEATGDDAGGQRGWLPLDEAGGFVDARAAMTSLRRSTATLPARERRLSPQALPPSQVAVFPPVVPTDSFWAEQGDAGERVSGAATTPLRGDAARPRSSSGVSLDGQGLSSQDVQQREVLGVA
jgi:hypothetical protein